ncbi:unnamed protein product, partial [Prorocentrum cordatum]
DAMTDDSYALAPCAICARQKRRCKLQRVHIPTPSTEECPEWLSWPADTWTTHKAEWYAQLDNVFSIDRHMEIIFCVADRLHEAQENVDACRKDEESTLGFASTAAAESWLERVRCWAAAVRADLEADSISSPTGNPDCRWLVYRKGILSSDTSDGNVVAYPQSPDAAPTALGMLPAALAQTMLVQFVGAVTDDLRRHPELQVSVRRLRDAFRWLSSNNWAFMLATRHHDTWRDGTLHAVFENLLDAYKTSIGSTEGVPREVLAAATPASAAKASVASEGPADCGDGTDPVHDQSDVREDTSAAVVNGGMDDVTSLRLWT